MSLPNLLAIAVLVVGVPLNALVTWMLWQLHVAHPQIEVLRERGIVSTAVLLLTFVFGLIFLNNDTLPPLFDLATTKIVTRLVLLGVAVVPALYWLSLYHQRDLRVPPSPRAEHAMERSAEAAEQTAANTAEIAENTRPEGGG